MDPDRRMQIVGLAVALLLVAVLAFVAGFAFTDSQTTVESTVVTTHAGNLTPAGDSLILVVLGEGEFAARVEERLEERLADEGYSVAVAQELEGHQGPLLVVEVDRSAIDPGIFRHSADLGLSTYYSTDWNATAFQQYEETGTVQTRADGEAVVTGEHRIIDRTRGLSTRYRGHAADLVVDAVADGFRGSVPRS